MLSIFTLPFIAKQPLDIPPLVSVELIQISDKTNIPFAPKAKKIIDKVKKENEKLVSEQAPPKKVKKDEKKEVNLDKNKEKITEVASKKTPTPETKNEIVKKEKLDAIPLSDKKNEKLSIEEETKQKPNVHHIDNSTANNNTSDSTIDNDTNNQLETAKNIENDNNYYSSPKVSTRYILIVPRDLRYTLHS